MGKISYQQYLLELEKLVSESFDSIRFKDFIKKYYEYIGPGVADRILTKCDEDPAVIKLTYNKIKSALKLK